MITKKTLTKVALAVSILLLVIWFALGTTSSIAWFKVDDTIVNSLYFGDLSVGMSHKVSGSYESVDTTTKIFDDSALYEPGYMQVAYLRIDNNGSTSFSFDLSVVPDLASTVIGTSVLGNQIDLSNYIKFGLIIEDTEEEVMKKTADRETAKQYATKSLSNYSEDGGTLSPGSSSYAALIVYLPEDVDNVANYRGDTAPEIELGISAIATQID